MAALREHGGLHTVTTSFPSVTGPAYVPFLTGRHAGFAGLPGLRWYDRARSLRLSPGNARSYAGIDIWHVDHDIAATVPTLLELARPSLSGMSMIGRGASVANVGRSIAWTVRAAIPHFRGDLHGWRRAEHAAIVEFLSHFARARPRFSVLAITSPDKLAHKFGSHSAQVRAAVADVDATIADALRIATAGGWRDTLRVWVVSDHGHQSVQFHDDLHGWLESRALRVLAHPHLYTRNADVALMVGGNAMAHLYLEPSVRTRTWWSTHTARWESTHDALVTRDAIDLAAVAMSADAIRVTHGTRGAATIRRSAHDGCDVRWTYDAHDGDPLLLGGSHRNLSDADAWVVCATSPYPDALVQLQSLCSAPRSGDIVLSAADGWDLRSRFEPVHHVSTHGALLRDQMLVPLLVDAHVARAPQRTSDVMPSVLDALGLAIPDGLDGRSFC